MHAADKDSICFRFLACIVVTSRAFQLLLAIHPMASPITLTQQLSPDFKLVRAVNEGWRNSKCQAILMMFELTTVFS
jgi:hypothetical protein